MKDEENFSKNDDADADEEIDAKDEEVAEEIVEEQIQATEVKTDEKYLNIIFQRL